MILHLIMFIILFFNIGFVCSENLSNVACEGKICISKCCPFNQYVGPRKKCVSYIKDLTFDDLKVFNVDKTYYKKNARDVFKFIPGKFSNETFRRKGIDYTYYNFRMYLTETGVLSMELPNTDIRWTDVQTENYCVDYRIKNNTMPTLHFWTTIDDDELDYSARVPVISVTVISCYFLLLVLIVYILLPEIRNLSEKVLLGYVTSLFFAYLFLAIIKMQQHTVSACIGLTYSIYFSFLASYCWMNIMSYDIWWSSRGYVKGRPVHQGRKCFMFIIYCIYGFGLPLAMTIVLGVLNMKDIMIEYPWFITPNIPLRGCFLEDGAKLLYLYVPILILILCNWPFLIMTKFNNRQLSRETATLEYVAAATLTEHRTHKHRFLAYLKLSAVMGLCWVLDVAECMFTTLIYIWYISDLYHVLIGVLVFLILRFHTERNETAQIYRSEVIQIQNDPLTSIPLSHPSNTRLSQEITIHEDLGAQGSLEAINFSNSKQSPCSSNMLSKYNSI